ncbi:hypothetical protein AQJ84_15770 [Streptomyces resistomycificus]|nr:hypothetical protein AQJ84_15770 [Streptomyces resistomycificus]
MAVGGRVRRWGSVRRTQGRWTSRAADRDRVATLAQGHATADEIDRRLAALTAAPSPSRSSTSTSRPAARTGEVLADAFPDATFVTPSIVIEHIKHSYEGKLKAWAALGPNLRSRPAHLLRSEVAGLAGSLASRTDTASTTAVTPGTPFRPAPAPPSRTRWSEPGSPPRRPRWSTSTPTRSGQREVAAGLDDLVCAERAKCHTDDPAHHREEAAAES